MSRSHCDHLESRNLGRWLSPTTFVIYAVPALWRYADPRRKPNWIVSPCNEAFVRFEGAA